MKQQLTEVEQQPRATHSNNTRRTDLFGLQTSKRPNWKHQTWPSSSTDRSIWVKARIIVYPHISTTSDRDTAKRPNDRWKSNTRRHVTVDDYHFVLCIVVLYVDDGCPPVLLTVGDEWVVEYVPERTATYVFV